MDEFEHQIWQSCYDDSWKGVIAEDAFKHPAKFSRGLIRRIYRELLERGWLRSGDVVVDPFGGVALGALDAMANGLHWVGCELEEHFWKLGTANIRDWEALRFPGSAHLIHGDSRKLAEHLGNVPDDLAAVICSPPYAECDIGGRDSRDGETRIKQLERAREAGKELGRESLRVLEKGLNENTNLNRQPFGYGRTEGQLGAMPAGSIDAVLSSPPYADEVKGRHGETETAAESRSKRRTEGGSLGQSQRNGGYGVSDGNLSGLATGTVEAVVSSPPFQGANDGLSNMVPRAEDGRDSSAVAYFRRTGKWPQQPERYGGTEGQLGSEPPETFWSAARDIVNQCHAVLKPDGIAVFVCKDFVRKGERVPFSDDWRRLCEACGFSTVLWVKGSLVKEQRSPDLFGGEHVVTKSRKSFFRRLAERRGSPAINEEDILFLRKV